DTEVAVDIAKRITPNFGIELGETVINLKPPNKSSQTGLGNLELGAKYEFFESDEHETILSLGAGVEIGGTGSERVGGDSFTTWTPALLFGKGFGDLPEALPWLRPLAITGLVGVAIPSSARTEGSLNPAVLQSGFAVEYSIIYLQEQVRNIGLRAPFDRLIPLVE